MMQRMLIRFQQFMAGRHGLDQLTVALLCVSLFSNLMLGLTRWIWWYPLELAALALAVFRTLSRNHPKRWAENQKFLSLWNPFRQKCRRLWIDLKQKTLSFSASMEDKRTHRHFQCPQCGQKIRVPKGRGKIIITCPRCRHEFPKKT